MKKTSEKVKLEKKVKEECVKYLKSEGFETTTLYTGGIPTASGRYAKNPAKGIPDLLATNEFYGFTLWIEFKKTKGGIISPEQQKWHDRLKACGQFVVITTNIEDLKEWIVYYKNNFRSLHETFSKLD